MQRIRSIDVFRGISIMLMVLFTLMIKLIPDSGFFDHNTQGEVHPGDFVLSLFLFVSGMSLVFFVKKREKRKPEFYLDVIERFGKLFGIGMLLSLFSAGAFLGMDEVSLSAILFILTTATIGFSRFFYFVISLLLAVLYFALMKNGFVSVFDGAYLGGYLGAIFYLPVIFAGAYLGKGISEGRMEKAIKELLIVSIITATLFFFIFPIDKMRVSPSFIALSVVVGTVFFAGVHSLVERRKRPVPIIESLGRKPMKYWVLMFAFFIIPYSFCVSFQFCAYPMQLSLPVALHPPHNVAGHGEPAGAF